jgi:outer membrane lipoprotein LolB
VITVARAALSGLAALALAGCATLAPTAPAPVPARLEEAFQLNGRFAVRFGSEGGSGRIAWEHTPATDDLTVLSPIGQGLARIVRKDGIYTFTSSGRPPETDRDPEALTARTLGWRLPIGGLPYWISARAQPGSPATIERGPNGRPAVLEQAGWRIEYQSYHVENGLPERIRVRREDLDLRLVLEEWLPVVAAARPAP